MSWPRRHFALIPCSPSGRWYPGPDLEFSGGALKPKGLGGAARCSSPDGRGSRARSMGVHSTPVTPPAFSQPSRSDRFEPSEYHDFWRQTPHLTSNESGFDIVITLCL